MNCDEFREQLERLIDRRTGPDSPGLRTHAEHCPACTRRLAEARELDRIIAAWKQAPPPLPAPGLADRVLAVLFSSGHRSSGSDSRAARPGSAPAGLPEAARHRTGSTDATARTASRRLLSGGGLGTGAETLRASDANSASHDLRPAAEPPSVRIGSTDFRDRAARQRVWPLTVTLALVMIAALFVMRQSPRPVARLETPAVPHPLPAPGDPPPRDLGLLISDARSAWSGLTRRAVDQASGWTLLVPDLAGELGLTPAAGTSAGPASGGAGGSGRTDSGSDSPAGGPDGTRPDVLPVRPLLPGSVERALDLLLELQPPDNPQTT